MPVLREAKVRLFAFLINGDPKMCEKNCSETCRERKDFCQPCQSETEDDFESRFGDVATVDLEQMTAEELVEIQEKLKREKESK